jgi:hypothetical protein
MTPAPHKAKPGCIGRTGRMTPAPHKAKCDVAPGLFTPSSDTPRPGISQPVAPGLGALEDRMNATGATSTPRSPDVRVLERCFFSHGFNEPGDDEQSDPEGDEERRPSGLR